MSAPFVPEGAPLRPVGDQLWSYFGVALMFGIVIILGRYTFFRVFGVAGIASVAAILVVYWRKFDRIGWYEHREVVVPPLPFQLKFTGDSITFANDGIVFSGWRRLWRKRFIAYSDIRRVETVCRNTTLGGVRVHLADRSYHSAIDAPELITEYHRDGETTRAVLAILRQRTPHAHFIGPQWVEEGWVPRLGFAKQGGGGMVG